MAMLVYQKVFMVNDGQYELFVHGTPLLLLLFSLYT
jgi:hypothetical protein